MGRTVVVDEVTFAGDGGNLGASAGSFLVDDAGLLMKPFLVDDAGEIRLHT